MKVSSLMSPSRILFWSSCLWVILHLLAPNDLSARPPPGAKTKLFLVSIGVSSYRDSNIRELAFADDDALALARWATTGGAELFSSVKTQVLIGADANRKQIIGTLVQTYAVAGPDDLIIVFLAGHGVLEQRTDQYYFLSPMIRFQARRQVGRTSPSV